MSHRERFLLPVVLCLLIGALASCSEGPKPVATTITPVENIAALAAGAGGKTIRYAEPTTPGSWQVDAVAGARPLGLADANHVVGLAVDTSDNTYASSIDAQGQQWVRQVTRADRVIWKAPTELTANRSGVLATAPNGRLLMSISDLGDPTKASDPRALNGKLVTLDPNGSESQLPNIISSGWHNPTAMAYDQGGNLWVIDSDASGMNRLMEVSGDGTKTGSTNLGNNTGGGLSRFGDRELIVCLKETHELKRFLLQEGRAIPGRTIAKDCDGPVAELDANTTAYASTTGLAVSK